MVLGIFLGEDPTLKPVPNYSIHYITDQCIEMVGVDKNNVLGNIYGVYKCSTTCAIEISSSSSIKSQNRRADSNFCSFPTSSVSAI